MVVSGVLRSKRCTGLPRSSSSTRTIAAPAREGPEPTRRAAWRPTSDAPHAAQNLTPGPTGEAQRGQCGPNPGAVSRRPQCGQNGSSPLARPPQKGQAIDSPCSRVTAVRATTRVPDRDVPPAADFPPLPPPPPRLASADFRPADLPPGFSLSKQNHTPGSVARPELRQEGTGTCAPPGA